MGGSKRAASGESSMPTICTFFSRGLPDCRIAQGGDQRRSVVHPNYCIHFLCFREARRPPQCLGATQNG